MIVKINKKREGEKERDRECVCVCICIFKSNIYIIRYEIDRSRYVYFYLGTHDGVVRRI